MAIWWPWVSHKLHGSWVPWRMNSGGGRERIGFRGLDNEWGCRRWI